jgi:tRNA threonylcarbamoyladenosine modification (KEOPS) complex  Pcc1 subunit
MSYTAAIEVKNPALLKLLAVEYKKVKKDRFDVSVDRNVQISAKDATAFKAILNSVANSIQVFEKMEKIK